MQNYKELQKQVNIIDIIGRNLPGGLKKKGTEYVGICPFHDDHKDSLQVNENKQIWACFACSVKGGDAVSFLQARGMGHEEIKFELTGGLFYSEPYTHKKPKEEDWTQVSPVPPSAPPPPSSHYKFGVIQQKWAYTDLDGNVLCYDCRMFNQEKGKKEVWPVTYKTNGKVSEWRWKGLSEPRPLYGLNMIGKRPDATVMLVEGCKTADAAQKHIPHCNAVTWQFGAGSVSKTDWKPLAGKMVVLFPDNDDEGRRAMEKIAEILQGLNCNLYWVHTPEGYPEKWDIADFDEGKTSEEIQDLVREWAKPYVYVEEETEKLQPEHLLIRKPAEIEATVEISDKYEYFFKILGYDTDLLSPGYWFYIKKNNTIVRKTAASLSKSTMFELANQNFWEKEFKQSKQGFNQDMALNFLIQRSQETGYFSEESIRGRGAWFDGGRVIVNVGSHLIVDGVETHFKDIEGEFMYNQGPKLNLNFNNPLSVEECRDFVEVIKLVNWHKGSSGYLFAGWCAVACICGSLNWRPHGWVTGPPGSGKSWVMDNIVSAVLGSMAVKVQGGKTTEAGLRQSILNSSVPVIYDEAEAEDFKAQQTLQETLSLARASSSKNSGNIVKGSAGGSAKSYTTKSAFLLASVVVSLRQQADKSRFSIFSIDMVDPADAAMMERRRESNVLMATKITKDYSQRLIARMIRMIPIILQSEEVFSEVCAMEFGSKRSGDQIGAQLAGYWALTSDGPVTREDAKNLVDGIDWSEDKDDFTGRDENKLIDHILQTIVRVDGIRASESRTFQELMQVITMKSLPDDNIGIDRCQAIMLRYGILVESGKVYISCNNRNLKAILKDTPWYDNHAIILERVPGAFRNPRKKMGLTVEKVVSIPIQSVVGE